MFYIPEVAGIKTTSDVYLTDVETKDKMQLSYVPEEIMAQERASFQSYRIIERGEVKVPKGEDLTSVSWNGILPGQAMLAYPFIKQAAWESPESILARWSKWKKEGTKLNLLITQTSINMSVYLSEFSPKPSGGMGNVEYSVRFVAAKELTIKTVAEMDGQDAEETPLKEREEAPKPSAHTVKEGDTLWGIAEKQYGDGSRWEEIYEKNRDAISDPDLIYPGQEIKFP